MVSYQLNTHYLPNYKYSPYCHCILKQEDFIEEYLLAILLSQPKNLIIISYEQRNYTPPIFDLKLLALLLHPLYLKNLLIK